MLLSLGMGGRFRSPVTTGHSQLLIFSIFGGHESPHEVLLTKVEGSANLWLKCKYLEGSLEIICGL